MKNGKNPQISHAMRVFEVSWRIFDIFLYLDKQFKSVSKYIYIFEIEVFFGVLIEWQWHNLLTPRHLTDG